MTITSEGSVKIGDGTGTAGHLTVEINRNQYIR